VAGPQRPIVKACNRTDRVEKLVIGNNVITDPHDIANSFAQFFANVGPNQARSIAPVANAPRVPPESPTTAIPQSIFLHPVVDEEIIRIIDSLKSKKSIGLDKISTRFVKELKVAIAAPLCILVNKSFRDGCFPKALKRSKTFPIFKKNDRSSMDNYCPISLLPVFGKIFKKAFCSRVVSFLSTHSAIFES
jgi:hypothetical protein